MIRRPVPRLHSAIVRLGMPSSAAGHVIWQARNGIGAELDLARQMIRSALFLRNAPLPVHPRARAPEYRRGFGRFPTPLA